MVLHKLTNTSRVTALVTGPFDLLSWEVMGREVLLIVCNLLRTGPLICALSTSSVLSNNEPVSRKFFTSLRTSDFLGSLTPGYFCIKATQHSTNDLCLIYLSYINIFCSSVYFIANSAAPLTTPRIPVGYETGTVTPHSTRKPGMTYPYTMITTDNLQCATNTVVIRGASQSTLESIPLVLPVPCLMYL